MHVTDRMLPTKELYLNLSLISDGFLQGSFQLTQLWPAKLLVGRWTGGVGAVIEGIPDQNCFSTTRAPARSFFVTEARGGMEDIEISHPNIQHFLFS